jgi:hypothetical protein
MRSNGHFPAAVSLGLKCWRVEDDRRGLVHYVTAFSAAEAARLAGVDSWDDVAPAIGYETKAVRIGAQPWHTVEAAHIEARTPRLLASIALF